MDEAQKIIVSLAPRFLIVFIFGLMFVILTNVNQAVSEKNDSVDISLVNSSFVPLSNTDANQVKINVKYTLQDEKMQNQLVNAVMEVYASNGTLLRTTSVGSGFPLENDGGEQVLKTSFNDKSLQRVSIKVVFTDLSKKIPLSNPITKDLKLKEDFTAD